MAARSRRASGRAPEHLIPRLHLVTDDVVLQQPAFFNSAFQIIDRLADRVALHIRGSSTTAAQLYDLATRLRESNEATPIIINDRIDIALASHAQGVQLGARSIEIRDARRLLGKKWVGYSAHDAAEATNAAAEGADWIFAGSIYPTATHPNAVPAGPALITGCARGCEVPILAIGGITAERVQEVRAAGAYGVAVIRAVGTPATRCRRQNNSLDCWSHE
jgi:thiazole tautomerase (transcriptional regulator TenI)